MANTFYSTMVQQRETVNYTMEGKKNNIKKENKISSLIAKFNIENKRENINTKEKIKENNNFYNKNKYSKKINIHNEKINIKILNQKYESEMYDNTYLSSLSTEIFSDSSGSSLPSPKLSNNEKAFKEILNDGYIENKENELNDTEKMYLEKKKNLKKIERKNENENKKKKNHITDYLPLKKKEELQKIKNFFQSNRIPLFYKYTFSINKHSAEPIKVSIKPTLEELEQDESNNLCYIWVDFVIPEKEILKEEKKTNKNLAEEFYSKIIQKNVEHLAISSLTCELSKKC